MIIDFNRYNGGGGSTSGVTPEQVQQQIDSALTYYWESGETKDYVDEAVSGISLDGYYTSAQTQTAIDSAITPLEAQILEISGATPQIDLSDYYTSAQTDAAISAATAGKANAQNVQSPGQNKWLPGWNSQGVITGTTGRLYETQFSVNGAPNKRIMNTNGASFPNIYAPITSGNPGEILVSTGSGAPVWSAVTMGGGNSNILAAISSQTEYGAISGEVKTGDLIQVWDVDINGDEENEYGLFQAEVYETEDPQTGVITKEIEWHRKDNDGCLIRTEKDYPWMVDNDTYPIEIDENSFLISPDSAGDGSYNGIGFDNDGKPVIAHIVPEYEEGEITGMTREDTPIGTQSQIDDLSDDLNDLAAELSEAERVTAVSINDIRDKMVTSMDVKTIVKLSQATYDALSTKDATTLYIITGTTI